MERKFGILKKLGLASLLGLGVATAAVGAGVSDREILIGTHLDLSGPVAAGMPQLRNGTQMRFDEANETGGVNGRRFKLIIEDNASQPQQAVRAMEKLVRRDEVFAIVNPFGSGTNAAVVKRAVDDGVIYFAPWGASAILRQVAGPSQMLFTTVPNYDTTVRSAVNWMMANNSSIKKVGVIYQEGPYGELVNKGLKEALGAKGMSLAAEAGYKVGDIDFSSQVARMKAAGVDLIVTATITRETIGVMAETKKLGWNDVKVMTATPGRTGVVLALGKESVEGLYGVGSWKIFAPSDLPADLRRWADAYKKRFNIDPDENAMLAYTYADMFVKGVQAAGRDLTAEKAVKALQAVTTTGLVFYGPEGFKNNHLDPDFVEVDQVKNGKWVSVSPTLK